ncbi:family 78 glycoside hydrolase catalytic domain [Mucilaginibacter sp. PAMB04168]|uniref:family 78 glycoside hydrolase catalytic domain n=1 Tax=Mucilaginibacter sp. PAMB04168 TaxID=3138567 RepID=UPI0031F6C8E5
MKNLTTLLCRLLSLALVLNVATSYAKAPGAPSYLRTCDKVKPTGTDNKPFFGWYANDVDNNEVQSAYQIVVASSLQSLNSDNADVWNSGKVTSAMQNYVELPQRLLKPASRYYWKVRTWDRTGIAGPYSAASYFDTGLFTTADWSGAKWVKRNTTDKDDYTYYRKNVKLGAKPIKRAIVYVAACHNYELYLNGKLVSKGSSNHYPQYAYYNAFDVTLLIKGGQANNLAALTHWYGGGQGRATGSRGFILKMVTEYADGSKTTTGTDATWKQKQAAYWTAGQPPRNGEGNGFVDKIDSRNIITGWNTAAYNDAAWDAAVEIGAPPVEPWINPLRADLTRVIEEKIKPVSVKSLGNGKYLIDLGKIYAGMPSINFQGGKAGDVVNIRGSYLLDDEGNASTRRGNQSTNLAYSFTLNGKQALFQPMVYLAYRYIQVDNSPNVLTTENVQFITRHFELDPSRAQFISSDDMLNQVWNLQLRSLVQGAQEGFVDTPTREKGAFLGDGSYQGPPAMATMGERAMNHRVLLEFLDSQDQYWPDGRLNAVYPNVDGKRDIPDYTQEYLIWIWDYYLQSGNKEFLRTNYDKLKKVADYVHTYTNPTTGLIHNLAGGGGAYKYGIIDWPQTMRYGYDMATESRTVIDALAYIDYDIMAKVAAALGNNNDQATYTGYASAIKQAINAKLLNANGVYIDGLMADLSQSKHISQQANMYAYATGIVPEQNKQAVFDAVKERKMASGMVTLRYLPEAIGQANDGQHMLDLYTNPTWDGWAKTITKGGTMTWEAWDADVANESLSHPWGAIGLLAMQEYMLGLKVLKPQHELVQVKPLDFHNRLKFIRGTFPTDKGNITLSWNRDNKQFSMTVKMPVNVFAKVYIPKCGATSNRLMIDGKAITGTNEGDYTLAGTYGSGIHTFSRAL